MLLCIAKPTLIEYLLMATDNAGNSSVADDDILGIASGAYRDLCAIIIPDYQSTIILSHGIVFNIITPSREFSDLPA